MKIPDGFTEEEVLSTINSVANRLAYKYRFGYHDVDDMKQEARLLAMQALDKYDNKRPLENFLWTHVRNRLFNFKRNKYKRPNLPCHECPFGAYDPDCISSINQCTKFKDKIECDLYKRWFVRNSAKVNLMKPINLCGINDEQEQNMKVVESAYDNMLLDSALNIIDLKLSASLREDYIKMKHGIKIPKAKKEKLISEIKNILRESEWCDLNLDEED